MRQNKLIEKITASQLRDDIPDFRAGDTVRVHARIVEGSHERIQMFEGVVIKRHGSGISATYTVRKISNGVGGADVSRRKRRKVIDTVAAELILQ